MEYKVWVYVIIGLIAGVLFFVFFENSLHNSFMSKCWERKQPKLLVHNKVYILGLFFIYRGYVNKDIFITLLGALWLGVHLSQDVAERLHEYRKEKDAKEEKEEKEEKKEKEDDDDDKEEDDDDKDEETKPKSS